MDPLSLLTRLVALVPPPRYHQVRYSGVVAPAHPFRSLVIPREEPEDPSASPKPKDDRNGSKTKSCGCRYRRWAELLRLTFGIDVLTCDRCGWAMTLVGTVKDARSIETYLRGLGEATSPPERSSSRRPQYGKSRVLRRTAD